MNHRDHSHSPVVLSVLAALAAAYACPRVARSQEALPEPLQEVVVTASLRRTVLQQLPASVSVLDEQALHAAGQQHLQDVLALVPNLNWAAGTSRPRYFQLRGVGETEQWQGAPNPSVGFMVDDIDFSGVGMVGSLVDLQQVEVLRGPQGTAYGANALAGLINLTTQAPSADTQARAEVTVGDFNTRGVAGVLGGALDRAETFTGRFVAQRFAAMDSGKTHGCGATTPMAMTKPRCAASWRGIAATCGPC